MKSAISETVQDMLDSSLATSFTEKELNSLDVIMPPVEIDSKNIKEIRKKRHLSQAVIAKLLNVSPSAIKHWEQGKRNPTGATKVLLEVLSRESHVLDYRLG